MNKINYTALKRIINTNFYNKACLVQTHTQAEINGLFHSWPNFEKHLKLCYMCRCRQTSICKTDNGRLFFFYNVTYFMNKLVFLTWEDRRQYNLIEAVLIELMYVHAFYCWLPNLHICGDIATLFKWIWFPSITWLSFQNIFPVLKASYFGETIIAVHTSWSLTHQIQLVCFCCIFRFAVWC